MTIEFETKNYLQEVILNKKLGQSPEAIFFQLDKGHAFFNRRQQTYLKKIIQSHIFFRQKLLKADSQISRLYLQKFFKTQFIDNPSSRVLGISFALILFDENEKFNYKHISNAIKRLIAGIRIVEDSYYFCRFSQENVLFCYLEIEKIRGKHLSFQETLYLKKILPKEIEDSIESSCAPLFMPSNEEEIYKNIAILAKEVSNMSYLPHVMISFVKQRYDSLYFNVVLVRLLPIGKPAFQNIAAKIPLKLRVYINKTSITPENIVKEICVFSVEIRANQFCRKNYSIHFLKIRKYLSLILERYIGEFRDFNGGLLIKQYEQLEEISKKIAHCVDNFAIIEEFFLSLVPSDIQPLISPEIGLLLYQLYLKVKEKISTSLYKLEHTQTKSALIILVKTTEEKVESLLYTIAFEEQILTAYTKLIIDKQTYFCFIQLNPSDLSLLLQLQSGLTKLEKSFKKEISDTLRIPFQESLPPSLHPHLATDTNSLTVCKALFEGLTTINLEGKVEYAIAKNIKISPCQKRYIVTLKQTSWSNGDPLLAEHFIKAWKKAISPTTRCLRFNFFFIIRNAKKFYEGKVPFEEVGIYAPSDYSLIIELEYLAPYFTQLLSDPLFSPLHDFSDQEPEIFNGPFKFHLQEKNKEISLTKNHFYWDYQNVKIQKIEILLIKKFSQMVEMFYKNQLDWVGSPFSNLEDDGKKYSHHFQKKKILAPFWLYCNTENPKLSSAKIRNALNLAIDRTKINDKILPSQVVSTKIIPKDLSLINITKQEPKKYIEEAKKLFKEGLSEINQTKEEFFLTISYSDKTNFQTSLAYFLKDCWEKTFGIKVILKEYEWNDLWNKLFNGEYEISGACKFPTYIDISYFLEPFSPNKMNFSGWIDEIFLKNVSLAKKSISQKERKKYLKKAEEILQTDMPVIPIYNRTHLYLCNPKLHNLIPPEIAYMDFKYCYFK
jgi:oligopeptide transport system substrate-binding protein